MDQPGTVANPARGQLNRENNISLSTCVPENLVSRDGFSRPVPRQPAHPHTQAESGAYLRNSSRGIVHRNRKRFLLSQSTLREEFVEKKYQVFDIIGLLTILVQVNLSSPVERVQKPWSFGVSKPQHGCGVCLSFCT